MSLEAPRDSDPAPQPSGSTQSPFIFISYRSQDPDQPLAHKFSDELKKAGCEVFMAAESLRIGDEWPTHIDAALERCDYFLLLLSAQSAASEMVMQEVRRAKLLREERDNKRPRIMPVRVKLPFNRILNYDLDADLRRIQQLLWESTEDTAVILNKVLQVIATGEFEEPAANKIGAPQKPHVTPPPDAPPLPVAEPEWPAGRVAHDSAFYVSRPFVDKECFEHILKPTALIRIRAPRQMGKTSLLARILNHATQNGYSTGQISFQLVAGTTFSNLETFLSFFCRRVARCLGLPHKLQELWDKENDVVDNCWIYFTEYLLPKLDRPFVLGLDETDRLFPYPEIAETFLGMLRGFIDGRENDELWGNFRVVLVHSTECYIALNVNSSPFNIGRGFKLPPFTEDQVSMLAHKHGLSLGNEMDSFCRSLAGHPYLTRVAFYLMAREGKSLGEVLQAAPTEAGPFSDHLRQHYWNLSQHSELMTAMRTVIEAQALSEKIQAGAKAKVRLDSMSAFKLEGMGLVKAVGNEVSISCDIYQKYFQDRFHIKP